jgi:hypothetical protein
MLTEIQYTPEELEDYIDNYGRKYKILEEPAEEAYQSRTTRPQRRDQR